MSAFRGATVVAALAAFVVAITGATARTGGTVAKLIFVDVGAGDGVVMRVGDAVVVSDIGEFNVPEIYAALERVNAEEIDVAILSHPHDDHIKNFELLLASDLFPVRRALLSRSEHWQETRTNRDVLSALRRHDVRLSYVRAGQTYHFGGATWTILNPPRGEFLRDGQEGNASIVYLLELAGRRLLFTGDIERAGERAVLSRWTETEPTDLLLVTHHGSKNASHEFFLDAVKPKVGVISVGRGHGHPDEEAVARLRASDPRPNLWCTAWNGNVTATVSTQGRLTVRGTRRPSSWWVRAERASRGPCVELIGDERP